MFDQLTPAEKIQLIDLINSSAQRTGNIIRQLCDHRYIPLISEYRLRKSRRYAAMMRDLIDVFTDVVNAALPPAEPA